MTRLCEDHGVVVFEGDCPDCKPARFSIRQTWIDPLATIVVVMAALIILALLLPAH